MVCQQSLHMRLMLSLIVVAQLTALTGAINGQGAELLETGRAAKLQNTVASPASIKIISYNIRWRGGDDLRKLIELFRTDKEVGGASILGLQEVDRNRKR